MFQRNNNYQRRNYNNGNNHGNNQNNPNGEYRNNYRGRNNYFNRNESSSHDHSLCAHDHEHSFLKEFFCHFPIALVALCFSVIFVIFYEGFLSADQTFLKIVYSRLFHTSHYIHILFATMGSLMMFLRFSANRYFIGSILSMIFSMLFCTISDVVLPSIMSPILGEKIGMHICFFDLTDSINIFIFSFLGVIGGLCIHFGDRKQNINLSKWLHGSHVWMSCLASLFYLLSNINSFEIDKLGFLILALVFSIVFPCVVSDTIIPMFFGKTLFKKNNIYETKDN